MLCIFVLVLFLINNSEMYRLETIISNYERDSFVFDKQTVLKKHYEEINKKLEAEGEYDQKVSEFVSTNIMQMALNIQTEIIKDSQIQQSVFSPISIAGALSLLLLGSKGQTNWELIKLFGYEKNSVLLENPKKLHDQFGFLLEDLLRVSPHPKRQRPVSKWKYQQSNNLHFSPSKFFGKEHKIEIANGLFIQEEVKLRPEYKTIVEKIYRSEIMPVDFEHGAEKACKFINEWTKQKTNGRIKKIISSGLDPDTTMVIASALYFKAMWETSFIASITSMRTFYPDGINKPSVSVETMVNAGEFPYYESEEHGLRILGIPYKGNLTTMYVILPYDSDREHLIQTQQRLSPDIIDGLISKMEMRTTVLTFPKMHIQKSINLKDIFSKIGVKSLFNREESDLSSMLVDTPPVRRIPDRDTPLSFSRFGGDDKVKPIWRETKNEYQLRNKRAIIARRGRVFQTDHNRISIKKKIFIDDILHKVDLTLNEEGTEGGAATISYLSRSDIEVEFIVDKPFLFFIRHDATKLPIFYGSIFQPGV